MRDRPDDAVSPPWSPRLAGPTSPATAARNRIVRNTAVVSDVKALHDHTCQVCSIRLETPGGPYAEGAHIRPLGAQHNGPDAPENILCLCPNHHVLFDLGAFGVAEDLSLLGADGRLHAVTRHQIDRLQLAYHREHHRRSSTRFDTENRETDTITTAEE